jgi:hypothetical protein
LFDTPEYTYRVFVTNLNRPIDLLGGQLHRQPDAASVQLCRGRPGAEQEEPGSADSRALAVLTGEFGRDHP